MSLQSGQAVLQPFPPVTPMPGDIQQLQRRHAGTQCSVPQWPIIFHRLSCCSGVERSELQYSNRQQMLQLAHPQRREGVAEGRAVVALQSVAPRDGPEHEDRDEQEERGTARAPNVSGYYGGPPDASVQLHHSQQRARWLPADHQDCNISVGAEP